MKKGRTGFAQHTRVHVHFPTIFGNRQLFSCSTLYSYWGHRCVERKVCWNVLFVGFFICTGWESCLPMHILLFPYLSMPMGAHLSYVTDDYWDSLYTPSSHSIRGNHISSNRFLLVCSYSVLVLLHNVLHDALLYFPWNVAHCHNSKCACGFSFGKFLLHNVDSLLSICDTWSSK